MFRRLLRHLRRFPHANAPLPFPPPCRLSRPSLRSTPRIMPCHAMAFPSTYAMFFPLPFPLCLPSHPPISRHHPFIPPSSPLIIPLPPSLPPAHAGKTPRRTPRAARAPARAAPPLEQIHRIQQIAPLRTQRVRRVPVINRRLLVARDVSRRRAGAVPPVRGVEVGRSYYCCCADEELVLSEPFLSFPILPLPKNRLGQGVREYIHST
jgi:hypothetical protein